MSRRNARFWARICCAAVFAWIASAGAASARPVFAAEALQTFAPDGGPEMQIWLRFAPEQLAFVQEKTDCAARLKLRVRLRFQNGMMLRDAEFLQAFRRPSDCAPGDREIFRAARAFSDLPPGRYAVLIEAFDLHGGSSFFREIACGHPPAPRRAACAGLALLEANAPQVRSETPYWREAVRARTQIFSDLTRPVTVRALLYRKDARESWGAAYKYTSVEQRAGALNLRPGVVVYEETFSLSGLPSGEYLIELYVFAEDSLLARTGKPFVYEWRGFERVYADLPLAVRQLRHIATDAQIGEILEAPDEQARVEAFRAFWRERYLAQEFPVDEAEAYYRRIYHADSAFREGRTPGWQTDRCAELARWGEPDETETRTLRGVRHRIWLYRKFNTRLVFRQTADGWRRLRQPLRAAGA